MLLEQSCTDITVLWSPPSTGGDPSSYNVTIWLKKSLAGAISVVAMGTTTYSYTFPGLMSDALYMVKVIAINCAGTSEVNTTMWTCQQTHYLITQIKNIFSIQYRLLLLM